VTATRRATGWLAVPSPATGWLQAWLAGYTVLAGWLPVALARGRARGLAGWLAGGG